MHDMEIFCSLFYNVHHIPVYYYRMGKLKTSVPPEASSFPPSAQYLSLFRTWRKPLLCYQTQFTGFYGYIELQEEEEYLVAGPVSSVYYSRELQHGMKKEFRITATSAPSFQSFFAEIPVINIRTFVDLLTHTCFTLTGQVITMDDMMGTDADFSPLFGQVHEQYLENMYKPLDETDYENLYNQESRLMSIIEHGNVEILSKYSNAPVPNYSGMLSADNIQHLKFVGNMTLTLACRAAIRGGLSYKLSYHMNESYLRKMDAKKDAESIGLLISQAITDYTAHVSDMKLARRSDNILLEAIRYIQQNFTQPITVEDVASHVGYSRSYLAKKFREELHFEVSSFIRRCRLEHARELLTYTDRSLSEISSYLNFSSQCHFQKSFKDAFQVTPLVFRKTSRQRSDFVRKDTVYRTAATDVSLLDTYLP